MAAFILMHGTGQLRQYWRFIVLLWLAAGHDVYTPTPTGLGAGSHLLHDLDRASLDTHVKDKTNRYSIRTSQMSCLSATAKKAWPHRSSSQEAHRLPRCLPPSRRDKRDEIALWPSAQKKKYFADVASDIKFRHADIIINVMSSKNER